MTTNRWAGTAVAFAMAMVWSSACTSSNPAYGTGDSGSTGMAGGADTSGQQGEPTTSGESMADPSAGSGYGTDSTTDPDPQTGTGTSTGEPLDGEDSSGSEDTGEHPGVSPCCFFSGLPGCGADLALEACVCAIDPACCLDEWSHACTLTAVLECGLGCPFDCCVTKDEPGCSVPAIEAQVCDRTTGDPACCDNAWSADCAAAAMGEHGACTAPQSCCDGHGIPGCNDQGVVSCVCLQDPFCCAVAWDATCARTAGSGCGGGCA